MNTSRLHRSFDTLVASILLVSALGLAIARGDDAVTPPRAARSVHLGYVLPAAAKAGITQFYNEVTVEKVVPGSYFMCCGFDAGYFGIQQRTDKKVGIFSVWDPADGDQKDLSPDEQVKVLFLGEGVRGGRFGGEGTGGHTDFDCDWVAGKTYRFWLTSQIDGNRTIYDAWFADPAKQGWMHVATLSTPNGGKKMKGLYSFIEDFRRDTKSATEVRRAVYGNGWVRDGDGEWLPLTKAHFTASGADWEAKDTIDAGVVGDHFYLQTGGDTTTSNPLHSILERPLAAK